MEEDIEIFGGNLNGKFWVTDHTIFIRSEGVVHEMPLLTMNSADFTEEMTINGREVILDAKILPELRFVVEQAQEIVEHKIVIKMMLTILNQLEPAEQMSHAQAKDAILNQVRISHISPAYIDQALQGISSFSRQFEYDSHQQIIRKRKNVSPSSKEL